MSGWRLKSDQRTQRPSRNEASAAGRHNAQGRGRRRGQDSLNGHEFGRGRRRGNCRREHPANDSASQYPAIARPAVHPGNAVTPRVVQNATQPKNAEVLGKPLDSAIANPTSAGTPETVISPISVDKTKCVGCGECADMCPVNSIVMLDGTPHFGENCLACGTCVECCPENALILVRSSR